MIGLIRVQGQAVKGCVRPTIAIFRRLNGATVKIPSEEIIATEHGSCVFVYITDLGRRNSVLWLGDLGRVVVDNGLIVASDFPEALRDACLDGVRAMHAHAPRIAIKDQSVTWTIKTAKHTRSLTLSHAEPSGLWAMIEHQDPADRIVQPNRPPHWFELHLVRKGGWPSWFDWLEWTAGGDYPQPRKLEVEFEVPKEPIMVRAKRGKLRNSRATIIGSDGKIRTLSSKYLEGGCIRAPGQPALAPAFALRYDADGRILCELPDGATVWVLPSEVVAAT